MADLDELATTPAEIAELLDFLGTWLGPIGASADYRERLAAYMRNNFALMFAASLDGRRLAIELTPRGHEMIARLPRN
jgi:hypothetical protein